MSGLYPGDAVVAAEVRVLDVGLAVALDVLQVKLGHLVGRAPLGRRLQ